ncbi:GNAT family N-acetyltransferase [Halorarum salinum]|uniref:GNAT family N-acetyltransferase n=1 Tax=Halorarum salinum TaxID=2743089 RepID=A0A7D5L8R8_9EURY|nr:GNAT family N-acetyltransferase [Halobaculum salinum]QLG60734.1 GNAT family N-acetyltransferase [Halobaculum salinum]
MTGGAGRRIEVREAAGNDALDVRRVLDGALLEVPEELDERIRAGEVLVSTDDGAVTGALVLDGSRVEAVAVRPRRRGNGIGSELVAAAAERVDGPLAADFRPDVRPFYESLGFEVEEAENDGNGGTEGVDHLRGRLHQGLD